MIRTSEVFYSFQGEGRYTGIASAWVRLFGCNLSCNGFGQPNPADPSTYVENTIDLSSLKKMEDLPVMTVGCDSAYSVSHLYKHLTTDYTPETLADKILSLLPNKSFRNENHSTIDLCITGGEPMLQQDAIIALVNELIDRGQVPKRIQIETNGTVRMKERFKQFVLYIGNEFNIKMCFNVSPKLFNVSGEKDAVSIDVLTDYFKFSNTCDLKFVMTNSEAAWDELNTYTKMSAWAMSDNNRIYIMPVGASKEQQETEEVKQIVQRALNSGYHISGRLHCHMLGNSIGT